MINKNLRNYYIGSQGTGTIRPVHEWIGKWYKPWTWFHYKNIYYVDDFKLVAFNFVEDPIDNNCIIKHQEEICYKK